MDRRTKILAALFGAVLLYVLVTSVVYPQWIDPLLSIDERIARRQKEYDRLYELEDEVDRAREEYKTFVARVGSFDVARVETEIRARLNELIEKHQLQDQNVTPSRPSEDRKTGLTRMQITLTAVGRLKSVIGFLKDVAELPQLVRVGNAAIYPASGRRRGQSRDRVNLRVPIEILVPPKQRVVGPIRESELVRPDPFPPRHRGRDYALIWSRRPFLEPIPLRAEAGPDVRRRRGQPVRLNATASGGDGVYTYRWSPEYRLNDPAIPNPTVDTSEDFVETYTVTVTDESGETATDSVTVTIETRPVKVAATPERERRPPRPAMWKDAKYMQLCMTLMHTAGAERIAELMVYNNRSKQTEYYTIGDEFNGGELVFVHPRGGVVRRNGDYFLYPVGSWLDQEINAGDGSADEHPDLKAAADRIRQAAKAAKDAAVRSTHGESGQAVSPAVGKEGRTGVTGLTGASPGASETSGKRPAPEISIKNTGEPEEGKDKARRSKVKPSADKKPSRRPEEKKKKTRRIRRPGRRR